MPTVREIWLSSEADLIQRYDEQGREITTGNTHMTAGFALGWAVREATLTKVAVGKLDQKVAAIAATLDELIKRNPPADTSALVSELRRVGDDICRQLAAATVELASLRATLAGAGISSLAAAKQE